MLNHSEDVFNISLLKVTYRDYAYQEFEFEDKIDKKTALEISKILHGLAMSNGRRVVVKTTYLNDEGDVIKEYESRFK